MTWNIDRPFIDAHTWICPNCRTHFWGNDNSPMPVCPKCGRTEPKPGNDLPIEHVASLVRAIEELSEGYAGEYGGRTHSVTWALDGHTHLLASYEFAKQWLALQPIPDHRPQHASQDAQDGR